MIYKITGGIFLILLSIQMLGFVSLSETLIGVFGLIAGIALLAGL